MTNYWKHLKNSWNELEKRYRKNECVPQQENDVVCYLYHALINRLEDEGIYPIAIRTEDNFSGLGRIDMNIDDRLLVEVRLLSRVNTYSPKAWKKKRSEIMKLGKKLKGSIKEINNTHIRQPVIALWNWKSKEKVISEDLASQLEELKQELKDNGIKLLYGPSGVRK